MERFGPLYMEAAARRWCWRLGVQSRGAEADARLVGTCEAIMSATGEQPDAFFFRHRGGRNAQGELAQALEGYEPVEDTHVYWSGDAPQTMLIEEVESIWSAIADKDDWQPLERKVAALRSMGEAHGEAPRPAGHSIV